MVMHTLTCSFLLSGCAAALTILQPHVRPARDALRWLHRTRDYLLLCAITTLLHVLALLWWPHKLQTRLVFQPSPLFFADTTRGRLCCVCSAVLFGLVALAFGLYELAWFLGYAGAPP